MKKKVRWIIGGAAALLVIAGVVAAALAPLTVGITVLEPATARVTFTEQGSYRYNRTLAVFPPVSGEVLEVKAEAGQTVRRGDAIAVIEVNDIERQRSALENTIEGYNAQIANLYTQEQQNRDALMAQRETLLGQMGEVVIAIKNDAGETLERQLDIQRSLVSSNRSLVSAARDYLREARDIYDTGDAALFSAQQAYYTAQAALEASLLQLTELEKGESGKESLEAQLKSLESQVALIEGRLAKSNAYAMTQYYQAMIKTTEQDIAGIDEKIGKSTLKSPADGVICELPIRDMNIAGPQQSAFSLGSDPVIEVFVPIREIDGVNLGDAVELVLDKRAGDETIGGTVALIEDEAKVQISSLGVEERKVRCLILPDDPGSLRIGYSMDIVFTVYRQADAIVAPKTALFEKDGKQWVWAASGGKAAMREVEKGIETRDGFVIASGLAAGDRVITDANTQGLSEEKRVKAE